MCHILCSECSATRHLLGVGAHTFNGENVIQSGYVKTGELGGC